MTANPNDVKWHCPYCDETESTLRDIQRHITETTTGEHEGISGESPDEDIVATDEDGDEVDIYAAANPVRPQNAPIETSSKRKQIVYTWLANDREEDADTIAAVTNADRTYVAQVLGQIRRGEITRAYWADDTDRQLLATVEERLSEYDSTEDSDNRMNEMSAQQDTETADDMPDISAKAIILNTYDLLDEGINRKQTWTALSNAGVLETGYEYFRRTYKEAVDGDYDVERAVDEQIQSVIESVLIDAGILSSDASSTQSDQRGDASPSSSDISRETGSGRVSVEELRAVREKVELLRAQAEYVGAGEDSAPARHAEFLGKKTVEWLDDLLEGTDS